MCALEALPDPVGSLVAAFPGAGGVADDPNWLREWFMQLVESYASGSVPEEVPITASSADGAEGSVRVLAKPPVDRNVRLLSIEPRYFRGFRRIDRPVAIHESLVVIEGRNSSGKTSLSEAIEWALTGLLSRRASGQYGHPRELANCITNEFTPEGEETWVEILLSVDGVETRLRRTLKVDYMTQQGSEPESVLAVEGEELDKAGELQLLGELFAGVHPILMQHTLRQFVHDQPSARRRYFERLLQIDELTDLIARAVVGNTTIDSFKPKKGSPALEAIEALLMSVDDDKAREALNALHAVEPEIAQERFREALVLVAGRIFPDLAWPETTFNQYSDAIEGAQASAREAELPVLGLLRGPLGQALPGTRELARIQREASDAAAALETAEKAAASLDEAKRAVAQAFDVLVAAGLINTVQAQDQECPVCLAPEETLQADRVKTVSLWTPIAGTLDVARKTSDARRASLQAEVKALRASALGFKVALPERDVLESMLDGLVIPLRTAIKASCDKAVVLAAVAEDFAKRLGQVDEKHPLDPAAVGDLPAAFEVFRDRMSHLEDLVGASAREDATYLARERWLSAAQALASISGEITWRAARKKAQARLEHIRKALITLREEIIEDARGTFSAQISEVWDLLRSDTGAKFSQLQIPTARGRGYKLELEVKASISDSNETREVDALRVFSESQINVIGIAAYVTRSRLLGHRVLIFDDPVQSMDEEHFRTFANTLLSKLLDEGFQVVMLTHSDRFAQRISHYHYQRADYMTLRARFSKRAGCQVDEGSRRIPERLKTAEKLGEDGKLEEGWRLVRLSIERLHKLVKVAAEPDFDPESWQNATADYMWKQGVGAIVEDAVTGAGKRLKDILDRSVVGAHDKTATSQTDLNGAIGYLRSLLAPLRVGG